MVAGCLLKNVDIHLILYKHIYVHPFFVHKPQKSHLNNTAKYCCSDEVVSKVPIGTLFSSISKILRYNKIFKDVKLGIRLVNSTKEENLKLIKH